MALDFSPLCSLDLHSGRERPRELMQANRHTSHLLGINGNWKIASSSTRSQTTLTQQIASICPLWGRKFTRTPTAGCTQERRDPADPASPRSPANAWLPNSTRNVGPSRHAALHSLSRSPQPSTLHQTPSPSGGGVGAASSDSQRAGSGHLNLGRIWRRGYDTPGGISAGISASTSISGAEPAAATVTTISASTAASAAAVGVQPPLAELEGEKGAPTAAGEVRGITLAAAERDWPDGEGLAAERDWPDANRLSAPSSAGWAPAASGPEGGPEEPPDVSNGGSGGGGGGGGCGCGCGGGGGGGGGGHVVGGGAQLTRPAS